MIRILTIAVCLLAVGCAQQDAKSAAADNESSAEASKPVLAEAVPQLAGQWDVTAIDGQPIAAASAMTASFAGGKVSISSGCLRRAWSYTQKGNMVTFAVNPGGSSNCGGQSPSGVQESAYDVVTQANIAIFGKDGSEASLSGTGGNLTLRRR